MEGNHNEKQSHRISLYPRPPWLDGSLESDTTSGFNAMLKKQKSETGECRITTVLHDGEYEILHNRLDLEAVRPITDKEYFVRGNTALLDAIGNTINKIGNALRIFITTAKAALIDILENNE